MKIKMELQKKLNSEMMGFSAADIMIYKIFSLILFLPKTVRDNLSFTTNKDLANASFPKCKNLKPTASMTLH